MSQNYQRWFTDWPSTHVNAGQTVEVVPVAELERAEAVAKDFAKALLEIDDDHCGCTQAQEALAAHPEFAPSEAARKAEREGGQG